MALTKVKINLGTQGNLSGSRSIIQSTKTLVSSSAQMHEEISGSFTAASSSFSTRVTTMEGSGTAQGVGTSDSPTFNNITATGTVTAQEFHSEFVSASVTFTSGSHKFGNSTDDVHNMTGSLNVSGAINLDNGTLTLSDSLDMQDNDKILIGTGDDLEIFFDGTNSVFDHTPGSGQMFIRSDQLAIDDSQSTPKNYATFYQGTGVVFNEDSEDHDFRVESNGNANMLFVDGGQNRVGIGTNNPAKTFHVSESNGGVRFTFGSDSQLDFARDANGVFMSVGSNQHLRFLYDNGSSEAMRIADGGLVGIGTVSPTSTSQLHVEAAKAEIRIKGTNDSHSDEVAHLILEASTDRRAGITIEGDSNDIQAFMGRPYDTANTLVFETDATERMRIASDGRVAIKATSLPQDFGGERGHLLVSSTDNAGANNYAVTQLQGHSIANDVALGILAFYDHSDEHGRIQVNRGDDSGRGEMIFSTRDGSSSAERMRIDRSGNVGIGTNNPAQPLHIRAATPSILFTDTSNGELGYIGDGADFLTSNSITAADTFGIRSSGAITIGTGGNNCRMVIESNGQIGIGTNSAHDNTDFEVNGNIGSRKAFYHTKHQNNSLNKNGYSNIESGFVGDDMAHQAIMYRTAQIYSSSGGTSSDFLTAYTSGHWGNHYHGWMYAFTTYYGVGHRKYRFHCSEGNLNLTELESWGTLTDATITVSSQTQVGSGTHSGQNVQKQTFTLNTNNGYVGAYALILVTYSPSGMTHLDNASSASDVQSDAISAGARLHFLTMDITGSPHRSTT